METKTACLRTRCGTIGLKISQRRKSNENIRKRALCDGCADTNRK